MTDTLTLHPCVPESAGCSPDPDPWEPEKGSAVEIVNKTSYTQTLWDITAGLLNPAPGHKIDIGVGKTWTGHVGNAKGYYKYNDCSDTTGPRSGTIDPS